MGGIAVGSLPCVPLESPANPKIPVVGLVVESGALPADLEGTVKGGPSLLVDVVEEELLLLGPQVEEEAAGVYVFVDQEVEGRFVHDALDLPRFLLGLLPELERRDQDLVMDVLEDPEPVAVVEGLVNLHQALVVPPHHFLQEEGHLVVQRLPQHPCLLVEVRTSEAADFLRLQLQRFLQATLLPAQLGLVRTIQQPDLCVDLFSNNLDQPELLPLEVFLLLADFPCH